MKVDIPAFSKARVLVVGDIMLDRYWYGPTQRISPEAPVPIVKINQEKLKKLYDLLQEFFGKKCKRQGTTTIPPEIVLGLVEMSVCLNNYQI